MAAKKDVPADDAAEIVPKGETADDVDGYPNASDTGEEHAADHATPDSVGDAIDSTLNEDPTAPPPPSTPDSPLEVSQARALFEDQVNGDAARFADLAKSEYIRATLGGFPVAIVVDDGLD